MSAVARRPTDIVHLKLRLPEHLRRRIEAAAEKSDTSMNLEIINRLEQTFRKEDHYAEARHIASIAVEGATGTIVKRIDEVLRGRPPGPTGPTGPPPKPEGKKK
jgi:hypothetical protein